MVLGLCLSHSLSLSSPGPCFHKFNLFIFCLFVCFCFRNFPRACDSPPHKLYESRVAHHYHTNHTIPALRVEKDSCDIANTDMALFRPLQIGPLTLRNRIILAPLTRLRASPGSIPNALLTEHYVQRADAGLLITEATDISSSAVGYPNAPGIWSKEQVEISHLRCTRGRRSDRSATVASGPNDERGALWRRRTDRAISHGVDERTRRCGYHSSRCHSRRYQGGGCSVPERCRERSRGGVRHGRNSR